MEIFLLMIFLGFLHAIKVIKDLIEYVKIEEYIENQFPNKWFTLTMLINKGRFNKRICFIVVRDMLICSELISRIQCSNETNDIFDVVSIDESGEVYSWHEIELKSFLLTSEFLLIQKPRRRKRKTVQKRSWEDFLPQGLRPGYT